MDEREKLVEKLREITKGSRRSKISRLREIFDEVETAKSNGASNKTIVAGLAEVGLIFDVNNFKNARSRILKDRALAAMANQHLRNMSIESPAVVHVASPPNAEKQANRVHDPPPPKPTAGVLERPPGITPAGWTEMQQKHKAEQRRQRNILNGEIK
jgi:hypothetical protein